MRRGGVAGPGIEIQIAVVVVVGPGRIVLPRRLRDAIAGRHGVQPGEVCIAGGIFAGTPVPVGGKWGLASKSPLTGFIGDSLSGSWFAIALKRAGWDGVVVHGASDEWVDILIDDKRVQFRDATPLLGMGTFETEEAIRQFQLALQTTPDEARNLADLAGADADRKSVG